MTGTRRHRPTKGIGALLGAALAALALQGWQVAGGSGDLPASLSLEVNRTGELDVAPLGRFLVARAMRPGAPPAQEAFTIRNRTLRSLQVQLRALGEVRDLDRHLRIRVTADRAELFDANIDRLRRWTPARLSLGPAEARRIRVRAWLRRGASGFEGRRAQLELDLRVREAR